jgi:DtxR family Mn-dependent transcriptional regulator
VLIEDALKHLYDCEYKKLQCTHNSLSGALGISADDAARLLARLGSLGLTHQQGEGYKLSDEGRGYALRVIRMHRLWERYLADETGLSEIDWHHEAEIQEHRLTADQADALALHMGNPRFDPHGDPIPTEGGDLPARRGVSLAELRPGTIARIVHIEDEPDSVYKQLVTMRLFPGVSLRVRSISNDEIRFEADGSEVVLNPIVAANVTVVAIEKEAAADLSGSSLMDLDVGEKGKVIGISRACRGLQRRRLMDLGVIPGTVVTAELRSAGGDPTAYNIRGASIALRKSQAKLVLIDREEGARP